KWVRMEAPGDAPAIIAGQPPILAGARANLSVGRFRRRCGRRSALGTLAAAERSAFDQIALLVTVLLEIGLVPAAASQPERRRGDLALHLRFAAGRAGRGIGIGH